MQNLDHKSDSVKDVPSDKDTMVKSYTVIYTFYSKQWTWEAYDYLII